MKDTELDSSHWAYGHRPVISFKIVRNISRPSTELVEKFHSFFVPDLSDMVGQLYTMDSSIQPLYSPPKRLVGTALTAKIAQGDNSVVKRALRMVQPGDVLVVDARGYTECCAGGAGMVALHVSRGLAGIVVDGAWRDVTELQAMDLPVYGKAVCPFSGPKRRPGEINVPVCCGGVIVHPGDIVVCDQEGGVVVPRDYAEAVADELQEHQKRESLEDWDLDIAAQLSDERDQWFEQFFQARNGVYVDHSED